MPPLSFLLLLLLLLPIAAVAASPAPEGCPNYACGNAVDIHYPFWVSGNDTDGEHCGYPSFGLECRRGTPVLRLPSGEYGITGISYGSTPVISAFDMALLNTTCPHVANRSLLLPPGSPPLLSLTARNTYMSFLLNCSFAGIPAGRVIPCLQDAHNKSFSFYFPDGRVLPHREVRLCQEVVTMPVLGTVDDVLLALRTGFELTWTPASGGPCRACEQAGGFCGQRHGQFNCFAAPKHAGRKFITTKMIVYIVATGIILMGGFTACCFIHLEKKRQEEAEADTRGFLQDRGATVGPDGMEMADLSYTRLVPRHRRNRTTHAGDDHEIHSEASPSSSSSGHGGSDGEEDEAATAAQRRRRGKERAYA